MKKLLPALAAVALIAALSANAAPTYPVGRIVTPKGEILFYLYPQTPNHMASFIKLAGCALLGLAHVQPRDQELRGAGRLSRHAGGLQGLALQPARRSSVPDLKHVYGAVGAGRDDNPQKLSAGCQFYIVVNKDGLKRLDGNYVVYGQVIKGMDVVGGDRVGAHRLARCAAGADPTQGGPWWR